MRPLTALWRLMTRFEREKVAPAIALRNTVGVTIPLVLAALLGSAAMGMTASMGALNVAYSDGSDPYVLRVRRMLRAALLSAAAVSVGMLSGGSDWVAISVATMWAAGAGLLVALDAAAADIGVLTLVMVVVFSGQPAAPGQALLAGGLALAGGLLQTTLAVALWPVRRFEPERRELAAVYRELARMASAPLVATAAPAASAALTQARSVLSAPSLSRTVQGERYLSLLSQAERIRLSILLLGRMRNRWRKDAATADNAAVLDQYLGEAAQALHATSDVLAGASTAVPPPVLEEPAGRLTGVGGSVVDAREHLEALAGQLRAAAELAHSTSSPGRELFERRESERPWRLRLGGTWATLRANVSLRSAAFRHALRLAACVGAGDLIAHALHGERSYWLPMTIAIVLKPDFAGTFTRGVLRVAGTFAGLALATILFQLLQPGVAMELLLIAAFALLLRLYGPANYGIFVVAITGLIVLLFALGGTPPGRLIADRAWMTLLGGLLALLMYAAWPTWEHSQVGPSMASMLDSYREYFRSVRRAYESPEQNVQAELDERRLAARLGRSNAEASVERFAAEPATPVRAVPRVNAILASSHRLVHAVMALEAGLSRSRPLPARAEFTAWANHVELTLYYLAAGLRGSRVAPEHLPDVRADHTALLHAGDPLAERYALVNIETDRITNSLNTLAEQVLRFLRA